ncbi:bifunctional fructose-bisphosphatase/inositol-phosphate phosphatase [Methanotorris igneus]|uniref:fructose-bisphosphatase n=1 Tax=Methanotorris igneus (strain DSM 5666 / JCM 11834 / Kol 5) TaxID=880724 RepID=F6BEG6_METIK|nr:bifunctional fructose-bisphosphatase/inositol-phosphate phosphatase [Methanotorris igneus]AEF95627.1 Inositol-phosphate phosphatase [Methanotorris igneus Kol 5]
MKWNEIALKIAKDIEKEIMPLFGKEEASKFIGFSPSGDQTKLVDKKAEDIVLKHLLPLDVNIVSEESGNINKESEYTVVIDPVDGSYNFINGIPICGFSFAVFKKDEPIYTMIYEFVTKNVYEGIPKRGAYLNGEKIKVRPLKLESISLSFYGNQRINHIKNVKRVRILGAIAIELAYMAKGSLDGIVDIRRYIRPTDIVAGVVIAKEAGAIITDENGEELKFSLSATERLNVIAVNSKELLDIVLESIHE